MQHTDDRSFVAAICVGIGNKREQFIGIIAHVIGGIAPQLAQVLAPDGVLVASGIIEERRQDAEGPLFTAGLTLIEKMQIDDWLALVLRKQG